MSDKTGIEWTDATWNPIRGCSKVSLGCANCYAERVAARFSGINWERGGKPFPYAGLITNGRWNGQVRLVPEILEQPFHWKRPRRIFVNSMSDLFHENLIFPEILKVFEIMCDERSEQHTFQVLTKRPKRIAEFFNWLGEYVPGDMATNTVLEVLGKFQNIHMGVSVEDQRTADERIPHLLKAPSAVRFLSCEPLLGPIELQPWLRRLPLSGKRTDGKGIDWVIVGGESGPGARPMETHWARGIRNQCQAAGVPFFMKQMGGAQEKGGDLYAIPEDLRIRQFPEVSNER